MNRSSPGSRRGITLIEMLMVITILAVVLGTTVVQLQLMLRLDQSGRARFEQAAARERLGRQLRLDIHDADSAEPVAENRRSGLRVQLHGTSSGQVEYWINAAEVVRIELKDAKPIRREVYSIPRLIAAHFENRTESGRRLIALVVSTSTAKARDAPPRIDEIVIAVGRDDGQAAPNPKGAK
jgi:prepilin-type N-terminal cleavage/methylation domain-containing protein